MPVDDLLRLAWQADRDGRAGTRDALLMLAIAESGPGEAVMAERCRRRLISRQPDHWLASFPTFGQALGHPRVSGAVRQLRAIFPPVRVQSLLLRGDVSRGPFTGRPRPLWSVCEDLLGPSPRPRRDRLRPADPSSENQVSALRFFPPGPSDATDPNATLLVFYLTVLLAIAILLASVMPPSAQDTRAA
jgi:hypothetical protein